MKYVGHDTSMSENKSLTVCLFFHQCHVFGGLIVFLLYVCLSVSLFMVSGLRMTHHLVAVCLSVYQSIHGVKVTDDSPSHCCLSVYQSIHGVMLRMTHHLVAVCLSVYQSIHGVMLRMTHHLVAVCLSVYQSIHGVRVTDDSPSRCCLSVYQSIHGVMVTDDSPSHCCLSVCLSVYSWCHGYG